MAINIEVSSWVILLIFVLYILKDIGVFDYLFQKLLIKHEQNRDLTLEMFRSNKVHQNFVLSSAIESFYARSNRIHEKQIESAEKLWLTMLKIRSSKSLISGIYTIVPQESYKNFFNQTKESLSFFEGLNKLSFQDMIELKEFLKENENNRIFLGERIWNLFLTYTILYSQAIYMLVEAKEKKKLIPLQDNNYLKSVFERVFTREEVNQLYSENNTLFLNASKLLEVKILKDIDELISGNVLSEKTVEQSYNLQQLFKDYEKEIGYKNQ